MGLESFKDMHERILVVDDDFLIRELLKFKLSRRGFEVITAGNEKEFWEKIFTSKPDLIILDILLKRKSGPDSYQNLVDFVGLDPRIPIIFITAYLDKKTVVQQCGEKFEETRFTLLTKPFDFEELLSEIKRLLHLREEGESLPKNRRFSMGAKRFCWILMAFFLFFAEQFGYAETIRGMASWYSQKDRYIRRHTANGEVFDDKKHTCAVWDYPFGTTLKVTNLENKKSVVCRVNDRGPAKRLGRKIDLTKESFKKLADPHLGLVRVSVTPLSSVSTKMPREKR